MNRKQLFLLSCCVAFSLSSCSGPTVEQDAQTYCDCLDSFQKGEVNRESCTAIMTELIKKYEFSPDETEELKASLAECMAESVEN